MPARTALAASRAPPAGCRPAPARGVAPAAPPPTAARPAPRLQLRPAASASSSEAVQLRRRQRQQPLVEQQQQQQQRPHALPQAALLAAGTAALALAGCADPAAALELRMEPSNALSLPTWAVHTSSVLEWVAAMGLM